MTIKKLPGAPEARAHAGVTSQISPRALDRWNPGICAAAAEDAPPADGAGAAVLAGGGVAQPASSTAAARPDPMRVFFTEMPPRHVMWRAEWVFPG